MLLPSPKELEKLYNDNKANFKNKKKIALSYAINYTLSSAVQQIKDKGAKYMTLENFTYEGIEVTDYEISKELKSLGYIITDSDCGYEDDYSETDYYLHFAKH